MKKRVRYGVQAEAEPLSRLPDRVARFSYFTSVIVFAFTAAFAVGKEERTTALIPVMVMVSVVAAIGVFRSLQSSAFRSIQLASGGLIDELGVERLHPTVRAAVKACAERGGTAPA